MVCFCYCFKSSRLFFEKISNFSICGLKPSTWNRQFGKLDSSLGNVSRFVPYLKSSLAESPGKIVEVPAFPRGSEFGGFFFAFLDVSSHKIRQKAPLGMVKQLINSWDIYYMKIYQRVTWTRNCHSFHFHSHLPKFQPTVASLKHFPGIVESRSLQPSWNTTHPLDASPSSSKWWICRHL